jgi:hypothetical protein
MSDARDLRTQREQEEAQFGQETDLRKAQLTAQNLAAQVEQQKLTQGNAPAQIPGTKDYYDPAQGSWMRPSLVNGEFKAVKIPGQAPADELKNATAGLTDAFKAMGMSIPPSVIADLGYRIYGGTGANPSSGGHYLPIPGAAGQPRLGADGKTYVRDMFDPSTNQNVEQPMPAGYVPPPPKPGSPATQFLSLYTKKLLADSKQGPPLTPEENAQLIASKTAMDEPGITRMEAMGQQYARYHVMPVTNDDGSVSVIPVSSILSAAQSGQPYSGAVVGAPTGKDKQNQMLAQSAIMQVRRMKNILRTDPGLTGPGAGQLTQLQTFLGTQDPDAQQFIISGLLGSEHGVAVFGGRNIHTINDLNNALGNLKTNPAALTAALNVIEETMTPWLTAGGRLPGPKTGGAPANAPKNTIALKAGGKVYNIPRDQVAAFKKDHPDATQ